MPGQESTETKVHNSPESLFFDPRQVAIVTNTLYKNWYPGELHKTTDTDKIRGDLAIQTFRSAIENGYRLIVADGGSVKEFKDDVLKLGDGIVWVDSSETGRGPQRRSAFQKAVSITGVKVIFYTQPEKVLLIQRFVEPLALKIIKGEADIVIPARNPQLFKDSYPDYMYQSEILVNRRYNQILQGRGILARGTDLDWFFGPVVFRNDPKIVELFMKRYKFVKPQSKLNIDKYANPENRSNAHYFPIIEALYQKLHVLSVEVPFVYPNLQRENETAPGSKEAFEKRRKTDRFGYWSEMIQMIRYLQRNPKAKIELDSHE